MVWDIVRKCKWKRHEGSKKHMLGGGGGNLGGGGGNLGGTGVVGRVGLSTTALYPKARMPYHGAKKHQSNSLVIESGFTPL